MPFECLSLSIQAQLGEPLRRMHRSGVSLTKDDTQTRSSKRTLETQSQILVLSTPLVRGENMFLQCIHHQRNKHPSLKRTIGLFHSMCSQ